MAERGESRTAGTDCEQSDDSKCHQECHKRTNAGVLSLIFRHLMMTATMEPATMEPATMEPATMEPTTVESVVEIAAVEPVTVEPITVKSAEAFAEKFALVISTVTVPVRGITVASIIPPSVGTSRQAEGRNQKRAKDNQFYFHYLMRRQAGRMTSGAEDIPLLRA